VGRKQRWGGHTSACLRKKRTGCSQKRFCGGKKEVTAHQKEQAAVQKKKKRPGEEIPRGDPNEPHTYLTAKKGEKNMNGMEKKKKNPHQEKREKSPPPCRNAPNARMTRKGKILKQRERGKGENAPQERNRQSEARGGGNNQVDPKKWTLHVLGGKRKNPPGVRKGREKHESHVREEKKRRKVFLFWEKKETNQTSPLGDRPTGPEKKKKKKRSLSKKKKKKERKKKIGPP